MYAGSIPPLIGMTEKGELLWGQQLLATDVTSFVVRCQATAPSGCMYAARSVEQIKASRELATSLCVLCVQETVRPVQVRSNGAGGPYLLYTTRQDVMYTLPFSRLAAYVGALPPVEALGNGFAFPRNRGVGAGKQDNHYTAMHAAMRCAPMRKPHAAVCLCATRTEQHVSCLHTVLGVESYNCADSNVLTVLIACGQ